jgi:hypothetical protein
MPPLVGYPGPDTPESAEFVRTAINALMQAVPLEQDDEDSAVLAKCLADLQKFLGQRQAEERKTLGDPTLQRVLARG